MAQVGPNVAPPLPTGINVWYSVFTFLHPFLLFFVSLFLLSFINYKWLHQCAAALGEKMLPKWVKWKNML
jgi:hypothetical protein